jgi:SAM-dependent methyltransferase
VWASDLSGECVRRARALHASLKNLSFLREDLSDPDAGIGEADFVLCANVLIMPSAATRKRVLQRLARATRKDGTLLLLVPSLESSLLAHTRRAQWMRRSRTKRRFPLPTMLSGPGGRDVLSGILAIDGVRTKHYLREELEILLPAAGWKVRSVEKVEYGWNTEFPDPPRWMKEPYPWDWVVEGERK